MLKHLPLMKLKCKPIIFIIIWIMANGVLWAQTTTITGVVTSADDKQPIPGVTVVIKGTTTGTITDLDGRYSLQAKANDTLAFSFVGMKPQFHAVGANKTIDVVLKSAATLMDEVVVVGYGTESKKLLTGSVSNVNTDDIKFMPTPTVDAILQGKTPGVMINQNSGTPGGGMTVRIRGINSISAGSDPLYIVDGVPILSGNFGQVGFSGQGLNAISDINPEDIESISILKDASSAAIYGARASNGVVLITTKRGKAQKTKINFGAYVGNQRLWKKLQMLDADQWYEYRRELGENPQITGYNTDWIDEVTNDKKLTDALTSNIELSASGGDEKTTFYVSGNHFTEEGVIKGTYYRRLNGRLNIDHYVNKKLKIGFNTNITDAYNKRVEGDQTLFGVLPNAISLAPNVPIYKADGTYDETGQYANPIAIANETKNINTTFRNLGNVSMDYKIIKGLMFKSKLGYDFHALQEHSFDPPITRQGLRYNGLGIEATSKASNIMVNYLLSYEKQFNNVHNVDAILGHDYNKYKRTSTFQDASNFPSEKFEYLANAATLRTSSANKSEEAINSFFTRIKYNYNYKYLMTLNFRYDGSSKFGENNKYGAFPGISLGWRISEEDFFKSVPYIDDMKLKLGYGLTGNDQIPNYRFLELYSGQRYGLSPAIYYSQISNPDLRWEKSAQLSIGTDIALLKELIILNIEYFNKKTKDLLLTKPLPLSTGFSGVTENIGEMENKGFEFGITTRNVEKNDLLWTSNFNFSTYKNEVTKLYQNQPLSPTGRAQSSIEVGKPIGFFYGYKSLGVDPTTGELIFEDINGDGQITAADQTDIGNPHPDFIVGLNNNMKWKNIDVALMLQGSYGNDVFNGSRRYIESISGNDNQTIAALDRWKEPGDITDVPKAGNLNAGQISSYLVEDGSYLRIKNLTIGYNFGKKVLNYVKFNNAKVYATVYNLYTFTNYSGMDPEVNYAGDTDVVMGVDFFTYPQVRKIIFGISVGL